MKLLKLLANASSIFKYANVIAHVGNGLSIAATALDTTIKEIQKSNPEFKYIQTLESLLSFIGTAKSALDSFTDIFGLTIKSNTTSSSNEDFVEALNEAEEEIKKLI